MPCRYDEVDNTALLYGECMGKLDNVTKMLCQVMAAFTNKVSEECLPHYLDQDVLMWWKKHQEQDAIRAKKEEEELRALKLQVEQEIEEASKKLGEARRKLEALKKK